MDGLAWSSDLDIQGSKIFVKKKNQVLENTTWKKNNKNLITNFPF